MAIDKNQAVIDYLMTCPVVYENPVFFNSIQAEDDTKQIITQTNDKALSKKFVDGSVEKRYAFTIIDFRSVTFNPLVIPPQALQPNYTNENVEDMLDVQGVIDWITEQNKLRNFPDFGEFIEIQEIRTTSENPNLNGFDTSINPVLAKYSITIQIDYLDKQDMIWQ